ncbi:MAG: exodeoxyribonuclease III [Pseudomonadota bacterium]
MKVSIATWNINSVRLREPIVLRFLEEEQPDILCLQEIKCQNDQFPEKNFRALGYDHIEVAGMKAYHGAATISKLPLERLPTAFCPLDHARHVSTRVVADASLGDAGDFELHNFYVPAGGDVADRDVNDKFGHKLDFIDAMKRYFAGRFAEGDKHQVIVGDFNIAPHENDVWSHKQLLKVVSHTPGEVALLEELRASHDFTDTSRLFADDADKLYSWWSYRAKDVMASNRGRRLDHIWVSPALKPAVEAVGPDGHTIHVGARIWEKPSDHVPVVQVLDLGALV